MLTYRLLLTLLAPLLAVLAALRLVRGRESLRDLAERMGGGGPATRGAIWLHGASNGELTSAKALVRALLAAFPKRALLITCNTPSARQLVQAWDLPGVHVRLAPVDLRWVLARFRARWRPAVLIVLENELWPNRIATATEPVLCVAARMSARSAARWAKTGGLVRRILNAITFLWPQDAGSAERFAALGLNPARIGPPTTLKSAVSLPPPPADELAALRSIFERTDTFLAASTHSGEDAVLLQAFLAARARHPALRLILAPRHPARQAEITRLIQATGLPHAIRSAGQRPDATTAIYLVDTLGEMPLWYALSGIAFIGGSLVPKGGHTPFEPALAHCAILHGPHVSNFAAPYELLDDQGGARQVSDVDGLTNALLGLRDPQQQQAMADKANAALAQLGTGADLIKDVTNRLRSLLPPG